MHATNAVHLAVLLMVEYPVVQGFPSWTVDGSAVDLSSWHMTEVSDGVSKNTTLSSRNGTTVTVAQRFFGELATETLLSFGQSGASPSPTFSSINTLDVVLPVSAETPVTLHGFAGSHETNSDFASTATQLVVGAPASVFAPLGGRSSNGVLPFFGLHLASSNQVPSGGFVFSIGWSGSWVARFERNSSGVRITAGLATFNASLYDGQAFRGLRVLSCNYSGVDILEGWNAHRKVLSRHYLRKHLEPTGGSSNFVRGGIVRYRGYRLEASYSYL
jgi:hypothetical protein